MTSCQCRLIAAGKPRIWTFQTSSSVETRQLEARVHQGYVDRAASLQKRAPSQGLAVHFLSQCVLISSCFAIMAHSTGPAYYINSVSTDVCNQTLAPGAIVFCSWAISGLPTYDSCFVSIRPISDLKDDNAYVADINPTPGALTRQTLSFLKSQRTQSFCSMVATLLCV